MELLDFLEMVLISVFLDIIVGRGLQLKGLKHACMAEDMEEDGILPAFHYSVNQIT